MTSPTKLFMIAALLAAASTPALAANQRLTDTAYLQAVRCKALAQTQGADTTAIAAMLKAQKGGRDSYIGERAKSMTREAEREAGRAGEYERGRLTAEVNGVCAAYLTPTADMASRR